MSETPSLCYYLKDGEPVRLDVSEGLTHVSGVVESSSYGGVYYVSGY